MRTLPDSPVARLLVTCLSSDESAELHSLRASPADALEMPAHSMCHSKFSALDNNACLIYNKVVSIGTKEIDRALCLICLVGYLGYWRGMTRLCWRMFEKQQEMSQVTFHSLL
jgi:hypothetical protein